MKLSILAADSMGVRSLCVAVETAAGTLIVIDPGASLAPRRYGLPPHPLEEARLEESLEEIRRVLREAHAAIITHYHYDHYLYRRGEEEYYRGLRLFVKHPSSSINQSQRLRAHRLLEKQGVASIARVEYADGRVFELEDVKLVFSPPMPHGRPGTPLGYVTMVLIEADGVRLVYASDTQGPGSREALEWILAQKPDIVVISGPPTYMEGGKVSEEEIREEMRNLVDLVTGLPRGSTLILDHHTLRDINYREKLESVNKLASSRGVRILTAAEFMGKPIEQLEAKRRELWRNGANR